MTFQKHKGYGKNKSNTIDNIRYKLNRHDAKWYGANWCGFCQAQKKVLANVDKSLLKYFVEDTSDVPKEIQGFPSLYIPPRDGREAKVVPGYKSLAQISHFLSQLP